VLRVVRASFKPLLTRLERPHTTLQIRHFTLKPLIPSIIHPSTWLRHASIQTNCWERIVRDQGPHEGQAPSFPPKPQCNHGEKPEQKGHRCPQDNTEVKAPDRKTEPTLDNLEPCSNPPSWNPHCRVRGQNQLQEKETLCRPKLFLAIPR
jgi:hypothetical protein